MSSPFKIRPIHVPASASGSVGSLGWECARARCAPKNAASGASSAPIPRATGQGTRLIKARIPMKNAATRARLVSPAESGTQLASTVELPKQMTMRTTKTAMGRVPVGGRHVTGSDRARLDQADSISRPQQPGEVVSLSDHVEIDVRAQVEAQVRLGCTKAGGIDVDGQ